MNAVPARISAADEEPARGTLDRSRRISREARRARARIGVEVHDGAHASAAGVVEPLLEAGLDRAYRLGMIRARDREPQLGASRAALRRRRRSDAGLETLQAQGALQRFEVIQAAFGDDIRFGVHGQGSRESRFRIGASVEPGSVPPARRLCARLAREAREA